MRSFIDVHLVEGDVLTTPADLACFKHAQAFYGADDEAVTAVARRSGSSPAAFEVLQGAVKVFDTHGALRAPRFAIFGTAPLGRLRYHELRALAGRMLALAQGERGARRLVTTVHGVRAGLDEQEAVLALVGGFVDVFQKGVGGEVEALLVVERNAGRARRMRETLEHGLAGTAGVTRLASGGFRVERSGGFVQARPLATAGLTADEKPHAFVAMPFVAELEDVFHYGILAPVKAAGLLCERVDQARFDGLIIERIKERIDLARVVIADLSMANPNVYLEVGYAWGRGRPTLLLVRDVKELRFDVQGHRCLVYRSIRELEGLLAAELLRVGR
ncbi:MAG: hypothetical protein INH37_02455 [Myxococcaceae bacterium]|nr:hypothetical protein [Myxococcaceae bacterium]